MGSKVVDAGTRRRRLHHVPDRFGRDSIAPDLTHATYSSEDDATIDVSRCSPFIDGALCPRRDRNCTDVPSFANQIGDYPVLLDDAPLMFGCTENEARYFIRPRGPQLPTNWSDFGPEVGFEEIKNQRSASVALTLAKNAKSGQPPLQKDLKVGSRR